MEPDGWVVVRPQADRPATLEAVHQACEGVDSAQWPARASRRSSKRSRRSGGEGAYTTSMVDVIVADPGPDDQVRRSRKPDEEVEGGCSRCWCRHQSNARWCSRFLSTSRRMMECVHCGAA